MKQLIGVVAAAICFCAPAIAADMPMPVKATPAPVVAINNWTGCYVGAGGGYGMWNQAHTFESPPGVAQSIETTTGGRGWFGTGQFGCDYQVGNWVVGAFADGDFGDLAGTMSTVNDRAGREHQKWSWAAGGRLGYVVLPKLLAYASGGFTQAHFDRFELVNLTDGSPAGFHIDAYNYKGWFIGSGYEYALPWIPGIFWKTEYRYSKYNTAGLRWVLDGVSINVPFVPLPDQLTRSHTSEQTIRSELVWRFN